MSSLPQQVPIAAQALQRLGYTAYDDELSQQQSQQGNQNADLLVQKLRPTAKLPTTAASVQPIIRTTAKPTSTTAAAPVQPVLCPEQPASISAKSINKCIIEINKLSNKPEQQLLHIVASVA